MLVVSRVAVAAAVGAEVGGDVGAEVGAVVGGRVGFAVAGGAVGCDVGVIAVGRTAERALGRLGIRNFRVVRHPSHGGKRAFIQGLISAGFVGTAAADSPQDYGGGSLGAALGEAGGPGTRTWISSATTRTA